MAGIAFWGLKTGQKQGGCCLNARTGKSNRKTTHTLKHMLNLRKFPTVWMLEKILNGVGKASNRASNIGNNTHIPMERWIRGVRPYKTHRLNTAFCRNQPKKHGFLINPTIFWVKTILNTLLNVSVTLSWSNCLKIMQKSVFKVGKSWQKWSKLKTLMFSSEFENF